MARVDHPDAGEANAQALDDLANGADGLQVVFSGALGAYGFGLGRFDSATLHRAFDGLRFDAGANFELDLGPDGPDQALRFGGLIERSGARPEDCRVAFGLDPFAVSARGPFPTDWSVSSGAPCRDRARIAKQGVPGAVLGRRRARRPCGWRKPRAGARLCARGRGQLVAAASKGRDAASGSPRADRVPTRRPTRTNWRQSRNFAPCGSPGRASRRPAALSLARLTSRRKARGA